MIELYSPLLHFYRRQIWANISFVFTSQQSLFFFLLLNLVEVTLNGHRTVFLSCENLPIFPYVCKKKVCKSLLTSHLFWTLDSDYVRLSDHSMTSIVCLYSNHKLRYTRHNSSQFYSVHCIMGEDLCCHGKVGRTCVREFLFRGEWLLDIQ